MSRTARTAVMLATGVLVLTLRALAADPPAATKLFADEKRR